MIQRAIAIAALVVLPVTGQAVCALTFDFPGPATGTGSRTEAMASYRLPVGPFADGTVPSKLTEGPLNQSAWRIVAPGLTTLQLLQPLREQVAAAGFSVLFECEARACGGFDFRYATDVLPEPDMHVDLGDYRYLAAERKTAAGPEYLSLIVSRAADQGFVQMIRVGQDAVPSPAFRMSTKSPQPLGTQPQSLPVVRETPIATPPDTGVLPMADRLLTGGAQVLEGLVFASGSATLAEGDYSSLADLAAFLRANPQARVVLVGHTDASGALEANIALSRQRAQSVRARLLSAFDIPARQIEAEGVGYLAPRTTNETEAGRLANRRVEVMVVTDGAT